MDLKSPSILILTFNDGTIPSSFRNTVNDITIAHTVCLSVYKRGRFTIIESPDFAIFWIQRLEFPKYRKKEILKSTAILLCVEMQTTVVEMMQFSIRVFPMISMF